MKNSKNEKMEKTVKEKLETFKNVKYVFEKDSKIIFMNTNEEEKTTSKYRKWRKMKNEHLRTM